MEITEQRRLKEEAASKEVEHKTKPQEDKSPPVPEDLNPPFSLPATGIPRIIEEIKTFSSDKSEKPIPANAITGFLTLILLSITLFFIVSSKFSEFWVNTLVVKLNALIVYGSFFVLRIIQGACTAEGTVLNTHYYKISLQGDLVALYSMELLIIFAALFIFFQKTTWIKRGVVFISLFPLAIIANIFRVVVAFGLALNYGTAYADRYFYGVLVVLVFIFIALGLLFLDYISSPE
jgi:exosortase/archaeosortase family protein